jgi:Ca2+:H+ antiporter
MASLMRREKFLLFAGALVPVAFALEHLALAAGQGASLLLAVMLVGAIILASLRVAHHAEVLANKVGEALRRHDPDPGGLAGRPAAWRAAL